MAQHVRTSPPLNGLEQHLPFTCTPILGARSALPATALRHRTGTLPVLTEARRCQGRTSAVFSSSL